MRVNFVDTAEILGEAAQRNNISGVVFLEDGQRAAICEDESATIIVLDTVRKHTWKVANTISLLVHDSDDPEADLESLAADEKWLYAVGSYSSRRKSVRPGKTRRENRARLEDFGPRPSRRMLARVGLDGLLAPAPKVRYDKGRLWQEIKRSAVLGPFRHLPGKENGIDIEGLVVDGDDLLVGFRGPVLRGNYAVVMRTRFGTRESKLLYLNLGGRGIRDLCRVGPGRFLILAGPNGDQPLSYELYDGNGRDGIPGSDGGHAGAPEHIGEIPAPQDRPAAKPEGIDVLAVSQNRATVVVVYDSAPAGQPALFEVALP